MLADLSSSSVILNTLPPATLIVVVVCVLLEKLLLEKLLLEKILFRAPAVGFGHPRSCLTAIFVLNVESIGPRLMHVDYRLIAQQTLLPVPPPL